MEFPVKSVGKGISLALYTIDTSKLEKTNKEDSTLDIVIKSRRPPEPDRVKYVSEVTRFGFKDLFRNYSYNPAIPYKSQVNPNAEPFIKDYLEAHRQSMELMKTKDIPYFNLIDGILSKYGLPRELKYLAVIESDLYPNALSVAGAKGPWQLMPGTARLYGLKINKNVDERTDYYKSTNAAAKYLLSLYKDFNNWLLVIAAYNGGPGKVYSAIKKSGSRDFWKLQYYLPEESRNHVKKFIATHYVMENGDAKNGFNYTQLSDSTIAPKMQMSDSEIANSVELDLSGRYDAAIVAKNLNMDYKNFDRYNPGFDDSISTWGNYKLRLPREKMGIFVENKFSILDQCVQHLLNEANVNSNQMPIKNEMIKK
jgi:peptidoglycan lytic transglycosylase D